MERTGSETRVTHGTVGHLVVGSVVSFGSNPASVASLAL